MNRGGSRPLNRLMESVYRLTAGEWCRESAGKRTRNFLPLRQFVPTTNTRQKLPDWTQGFMKIPFGIMTWTP